MTLEINFRLPFMREFLLLHGVVDASKSSCLWVLGKGSGQAILLAVGGAQESLLAEPGTYDVVSRAGEGGGGGRCTEIKKFNAVQRPGPASL